MKKTNVANFRCQPSNLLPKPVSGDKKCIILKCDYIVTTVVDIDILHLLLLLLLC